ncbi:MAG TPA: hypothetical protein VD927_04270 [Chryseosolibacter sp.]|nr:hypothetical protein [Chryseosolibacter sp.]
MNKNVVDIPTGALFQFHFHFMAIIVMVVAFAVIKVYFLVSLILLTVGGFILSGRSGIQVDMNNNLYREYLSFFFIKWGKFSPFNNIEKIFINSSKVTRTMYGPMSNRSASFTNRKYNAFLKFDDGTKLLLMSKGNKDKLLRNVKVINARLKTIIDDQTVEVAS